MKTSTGVGLGVLVVVVLALISCFHVVSVGNVGIVTRVGTVNREQGSGVLFTAPFPIESVTEMNVQIQKEQQDASAATHDLQAVTSTIAVNYHLTPDTAKKVFNDVGAEYKDRIISPIIQESVKAVTAQYDASDLIANRATVEGKLDTLLVTKLTDRGITVDSVSIVNFAFSDQFNQAIEQKQVAQQNAEKAQYDLQKAQLEAQAQEVQAKTLTPEYLQLQAINKWDGKLPANTLQGGSTVFNIPLQ